MKEKSKLLRSFQQVVTANTLIAEIYQNSSLADEFIELFTLQFITEQLDDDELKVFSSLLEKHNDGALLAWIKEVIPHFEKQFVIKLRYYLQTVH